MSRFPDLPPPPEPWQPQFEAHIQHIMSCKSCHAPTGRYCGDGVMLWREYDNAVKRSEANK